MRTLKNGMSGGDVKAWNEFLGRQRLLPPNGVNDKFDAATEVATVKFQQANGVRQTGQVDQATFQQARRIGFNPSSDNSQSNIISTGIDIEKIPQVMRSKKWLNAARLMEQWLERQANDSPENGVPETTTVKMDSWALTFARANNEFQKLINEKIWINDKAKIEIVKMLKKLSAFTYTESRRFGNFNRHVMEIDRDYVNFRAVGYPLADPLDDMFAALGNFTFRVAVQGIVTPLGTITRSGGRYKITIESVGVYIRDSYDFNDQNGFDQYLGSWNTNSGYVGKDLPAETGARESIKPFHYSAGVPLYNSHFREWRRKNHKGGDFVIYSDLKVIKLSFPDIFEVQIQFS